MMSVSLSVVTNVEAHHNVEQGFSVIRIFGRNIGEEITLYFNGEDHVARSATIARAFLVNLDSRKQSEAAQ